MQHEAPRLSTRLCEWSPARRTLTVASETFGGSFPRRIDVVSHHTGRLVVFFPVQPGDSRWDADGWDGEQRVYRAADVTARAETLVFYHAS